MLTLPIGFITTLLVLYLSISQESWPQYLNAHSIIIVVGGTASLLLFTTPFSSLKSLVYATFKLLQREKALHKYLDAFKSLSGNKSANIKTKDPLIDHAIDLWNQGISEDLFVVLISQKRVELEEKYLDAITALKSLAKYPPALGMTGTVIGMIDLFSTLDSGNKSNIGPSLALAMTATFFGLMITNGFVQPMADRLNVKYVQNKRHYRNILQILLLINGGEATAIIEDEVKGRAR